MNTFITGFRALHDKAKNGSLTPEERARYERGRDELGRMMLIAQSATHAGRTLRARFRVAQMFKIELDVGTIPFKTSTLDVALGGFAVLLPNNETVGKTVPFRLTLPGFPHGTKQVAGTARVASSRAQGRSYRVSFTFADVTAADVAHLELVIIDSLLARFPTVGF